MQIRVKLFAILREMTGISECNVDVSAGATVAHVMEQLCSQHLALAPFRDRCATAVNMEYVDLNHQLNDGDELALIPPVSGG